MFSLIITIISVALVAALALATLYYGGETFNQGRADAQAAQILNQGQQVLGAAELYYLKNGEWPAATQDLVDEGFLDAIPVVQAPQGSVSTAVAAAREWVMPTAGVPVFTLPNIETDICRTVNKKTYGLDGVLKQAYTSLAAQCYGETSNAYTVVVSKGGDKLPDALPVPEVAGTPTLPATTEVAAWDQIPGEASTGGAAPPPSGGTGGDLANAADCLVVSGNTGLEWNTDGWGSDVPATSQVSFSNQCDSSIDVLAYESYWSPTNGFSPAPYPVTRAGESDMYLPSLWAVDLTWNDPGDTTPVTGGLRFDIMTDYYNQPVGSLAEDTLYHPWLTTTGFSLDVWHKNPEQGYTVRTENTVQVVVKYSSEPESAYQAKTFPVSGTFRVAGGCGGFAGSGDYSCVE